MEVLRGDQTNFVHADELLSSWRIFTPALHELAARHASSSSSSSTATPPGKPFPYAHGSAGPEAEERHFAARFGFPAGFAHGLSGGGADDREHNRLALAWGKASKTSLASVKFRTERRGSSDAGNSAAGSSADGRAESGHRPSV